MNDSQPGPAAGRAPAWTEDMQTRTAIRTDAISRRFAEYEPPDRLGSDILSYLRMARGVLRALFIVSLLIATIDVSMPQREHVWTAYAAPADFIRMILGFVVCVWLAIQLFSIPRDARAYRNWLYLS